MNSVRLFFRDDDLGWAPAQFDRMLALFEFHGQKVTAAAMPSLAQEPGLAVRYRAKGQHLQVVAHGYSHTAHQTQPKKSEYPAGRDLAEVSAEFSRGLADLQKAYGPVFYAAFVPPWNRVDAAYIPLLREAGYSLLSRSGPNPRSDAANGVLPELNANLDLHTLKTGPLRNPQKILVDIERTLAAEAAAVVMLHHGKMAEEDFEVLASVLDELGRRGIRTGFFSEWKPGGNL